MRRVRVTIEWGKVQPAPAPDREGSADALVERVDPHAPSLGFVSTPRPSPDDKRSR